MELYFLDKGLNRITQPIDTVISLIWRMRFFECGSFRAVFPLDVRLTAAAQKAEYLCAVRDGTIRCGRIETCEITADGIRLEGRLPECLLADHVIEGRFLRAGMVSAAVLRVVSENCRELPLAMGADSDVIERMGSFSADWDNLASWVYRVLRPYGASFRVELDPEMGVFLFRVVNPVRENGMVFSSSFGNIFDLAYCRKSSSLKNKVYIEGKDGKTIWMDVSNGMAKKELYRKADDLSWDMFETEAEYTEALMTRAKEVLAEYTSDTVVRYQASADEMLRFERDYHLGDFCYAADENMGIYAKVRIVGADEVWENGGRTLKLSLML